MASSSSMSPKAKLPVVLLLLAAAALALASPVAAQNQQPQEYCRDSLAGLMECQSFMHGAAAASPACCAAYEAAFDADPFCLCYVADGTFARATGTVVDVARALQIPISCGQAAPPVELCNMQGIVLPPYEPKGSPAVAAAPEASAPAPVQAPSGSVTPPSFTTSPSPPSPTSAADRTFTIPAIMIITMAAAVAAMC